MSERNRSRKAYLKAYVTVGSDDGNIFVNLPGKLSGSNGNFHKG